MQHDQSDLQRTLQNKLIYKLFNINPSQIFYCGFQESTFSSPFHTASSAVVKPTSLFYSSLPLNLCLPHFLISLWSQLKDHFLQDFSLITTIKTHLPFHLLYSPSNSHLTYIWLPTKTSGARTRTLSFETTTAQNSDEHTRSTQVLSLQVLADRWGQGTTSCARVRTSMC